MNLAATQRNNPLTNLTKSEGCWGWGQSWTLAKGEASWGFPRHSPLHPTPEYLLCAGPGPLGCKLHWPRSTAQSLWSALPGQVSGEPQGKQLELIYAAPVLRPASWAILTALPGVGQAAKTAGWGRPPACRMPGPEDRHLQPPGD